MIRNTLQTNLSESSDLFTPKLIVYVLILAITPSYFIFKTKIKYKSFKEESFKKLKTLFLSLVIILIILFLFFSLTAISSVSAQGLLTKKVEKILFLGNSITYSGQYITYLETYLINRYPKRQFEFINVGLPSETVSGLSEFNHAAGKFPRPDLHERLTRVLEQIKPDIVFACYGMNDGIYQPYDEDRFKNFKDGINWLHDKVSKIGLPIIHVTPPVYDEVKGGKQGYSAVLDTYSSWLLQQIAIKEWQVIDVHFPMKELQEKRRLEDPEFAFANDGIHPGEFGHWFIAKQFLKYIGESSVEDAGEVLSAIGKSYNKEKILELVAQRQAIMKDAWLTVIKHKRPGMNKGLPLAEAQVKAAEIEKQIRFLLKNNK